MASFVWTGATSTSWSTGSNWKVGGVTQSNPPTAADDVFFGSGTGATNSPCTLTNGAVCRSIDCTGYTGTLTHPAAVTWSIGDGTPGIGNNILKFAAGMTFTVGNSTTSVLAFRTTSSTQQTFTTAGKVLGYLQVTAADGNYLQADPLTTTGSALLLNAACTWNTGGFANTHLGLQTGASGITLTFGSSTFTLSSSAAPLRLEGSPTITANTATMICTSISPTINQFSGGAINMNGASLVFTPSGAGTPTLYGGTWANITFTGAAAVKTHVFQLAGDVTCTGTFTVSGSSAVDRVLVASSSTGVPRVISAAAVSASNVDFMDITGAGAANWNLSAITGGSGDCLGNTGITFTAPMACAATSTTGVPNATWSTHPWSGRVPLPQDDVVIANWSAGQVIAVDVPRIGKNVTVTHTQNTFYSSSLGASVFGNYSTASNISANSPQTLVLRGRGTHTFTSGLGPAIVVDCPGGTYTMSAPYVVQSSAARSVVVSSGSLVTSHDITAAALANTGGTLTLGPNVTLTATTTASVLTLTGGTTSAASTTFTITGASNNTKTVTLASTTIGALTYTVKSPGQLSVASNFTTPARIGTLSVGPGRPLVLGTGVNVDTWDVAGEARDHAWFFGAGYISVPDTPETSWTGDFDLRVRMKPESTWASPHPIAGKATGNTTNCSWQWVFNATSRAMSFITSTNGTSSTSAICTVAVPFADGDGGWLRVTRRASDGRVQFFTAPDSSSPPSSWTQLGADRTGVVGTLYDSTAPLVIAAYNTSNAPNSYGRYYRFQGRDNIADDGTGIQLDVDLSTKPFGSNTFTESSPNAATVTMALAGGQVADGRIALSGSIVPTLGPVTLSRVVAALTVGAMPHSVHLTDSIDGGSNQSLLFSAPPGGPTIRQRAYGIDFSSGGGVSFVHPVQVGNLLLLATGFTTSADYTSFTPPTGFILAVERSRTGSASRIYYKIADGTETSLPCTWGGSGTGAQMMAYEVSGFVGTPTLDVVDSNESGAATSIATGAGVTNTGIPAFALVSLSGNGSLGASSTTPPTDSYQEDWGTGQATGYVLKTFAKPLTATELQAPTVRWGTSRAPTIVLAAFKDVADSTAFLAFM